VEACGQDVELVLAGDGPDEHQLRILAADLQISEKVRFAGYVSRIVCEMVSADIFVHASETEGLSNAVLEAMELGLPSVVVDAPGVTECHVDGETGYIVERQDRALASRLISLVNDMELRNAMGGRAHQHVRETYSMVANLTRYQALYTKLLAGA
jgi:glycosyltransferase involved in cell wall biosynthesis